MESPWTWDVIKISYALFRIKYFGEIVIKIAKTLLVIPTGGGKTLTAIRAINSMLEDQLLNSTDCVYWVVHSVALCIQTQNVLDNNIIWGKFLNNLENCHSDLRILGCPQN